LAVRVIARHFKVKTFERRAVDQEVARSLRAAQIAPNVRVDPK
jgi:hypothetical protein